MPADLRKKVRATAASSQLPAIAANPQGYAARSLN